MSRYLIQLALGPVQGFIATARRTRDLWFGSYILSEISKAAARALVEREAKLIFPAPSKQDDLKPWSDFSVVNIVTAELMAPDLKSAEKVLDTAKAAARDRWQELCDEAQQLINAKGFVEDAIWQAQLNDVVELFAAIVPWDGSYRDANERLRALLASRKNTRDFAPYKDTFQRPKSSLDGAQSTVLVEPQEEGRRAAISRLRRRLGIEENEQLDTAGMVKRVVGRSRGFLPAARVAAQPWLERAQQTETRAVERLKASFDKLERLDLATGLKDWRYLNYRWVDSFPYDAQLLFPQRIEAEAAKALAAIQLRNDAGRQEDEGELAQAIACLRAALKPLLEKLGPPCPYYGLVLADGDRMGRLIDKAAEAGADAHREISRALSEFAGKVPQIMSDHGGACIYSGGDDVLGLVALPQAVCCGFALAEGFRARLLPLAEKHDLKDESPTLSVGIVIAHMLEPLGDVRRLASEAEKLAKGKKLPPERQGNALGLLLKPRGGDVYACRIRWDDEAALGLLHDWQVKLAAGTLPRGLPDELYSLFGRAEQIGGALQRPQYAVELWKALLTATLRKKRAGGGAEVMAEEEKSALIEALTTAATDAEQIRARLDLLRAARWLSGHIDDQTG